jgi:hypothetical protein
MDFLEKMEDNSDWQVIAHTSQKESASELLDLYDDICIEIASYNQKISNHATAIPTSSMLPHKKLLLDFYKNPPSGLDKLIQQRRNKHELVCCPYCGSPFAPDTLDHFIPKDEWPEFSIHPNNLVPQCDECAPIKGSDYYCATNNYAFFIHPVYSDIISRVRFEIEVIFQAGDSAAEFKPKFFAGELSAEETVRAKNHLKKLRVRDRITVYCNSEISRLKNLLTENTFDILVAIEQRIREHEHEGSRAKNWKTALYKGMKENKSFIDYLNGLRPQDTTVPNEPEWTEFSF